MIHAAINLPTHYQGEYDSTATEITHPMKFITTRCKTTWANRKSANALSGDIPEKSVLFWGLICILKQDASTNEATHEINPDRKALKGNVPTMQQ